MFLLFLSPHLSLPLPVLCPIPPSFFLCLCHPLSLSLLSYSSLYLLYLYLSPCLSLSPFSLSLFFSSLTLSFFSLYPSVFPLSIFPSLSLLSPLSHSLCSPFTLLSAFLLSFPPLHLSFSSHPFLSTLPHSLCSHLPFLHLFFLSSLSASFTLLLFFPTLHPLSPSLPLYPLFSSLPPLLSIPSLPLSSSFHPVSSSLPPDSHSPSPSFSPLFLFFPLPPYPHPLFLTLHPLSLSLPLYPLFSSLPPPLSIPSLPLSPLFILSPPLFFLILIPPLPLSLLFSSLPLLPSASIPPSPLPYSHPLSSSLPLSLLLSILSSPVSSLLLPPLPPPCLHVLCSPVMDLIYWKDTERSGMVLTGIVVALLSVFQLSIVSVLSTVSLLLMCVTISVRLYYKLLQAIQWADNKHPFQKYMELDITLHGEEADLLMQKAIVFACTTLDSIKNLVFVSSLFNSLKVRNTPAQHTPAQHTPSQGETHTCTAHTFSR
ncbi:hypothetical protein ACEWY4_008512 [Coilia grayii]|uniref:Reticulon n=1 Tax=Coilia grayii TaxID=363190 RepID=A0ABD1KB98_9TELE